MAITINDAAAFVRWLRERGREVEDCDAAELRRLYQRFTRLR